jgi:hypothetical protein
MFSQNYFNDLQKNNSNSTSICEVKRNYFKVEPNKYIDMVIIPYRAGANNPLVIKRVIAQGEWVFSLDLFVHSKIGADKKDYICPKSWGGKCPLCDLQYKIYTEQGKDAASSLRAKQRSWLNMSLCDEYGSRYGEMLVFNPSYYLFTEKLLEAAIAENRGAGIYPFADIENGGVVSCHTIEDVLGKNKWVAYSNFKFCKKRTTPMPNEFVRSAICFENFLHMPDMKELQELASDSAAWQVSPNAPQPPQPAYNLHPSNFSQTAPQLAFSPVGSAPPNIGHPPPVSVPFQQLPPQPMQPQLPPQPMQPEGDVMCPSGLRFGVDCDTQRACSYCEVFDSCKLKK